jgi:hypothetical protein
MSRDVLCEQDVPAKRPAKARAQRAKNGMALALVQ